MHAFEIDSFRMMFPAVPKESHLPDGSRVFDASDGERTVSVMVTTCSSDAEAIAALDRPFPASGAVVQKVARDIDGAKGVLLELVGAPLREWALRLAQGTTLVQARASTTAADEGARSLLLTLRLPPRAPATGPMARSGAEIASDRAARMEAERQKVIAAARGKVEDVDPAPMPRPVAEKATAKPSLDIRWYEHIVGLIGANPVMAAVEARVGYERIDGPLLQHAEQQAKREIGARREYVMRLSGSGVSPDGAMTERARAAHLLKILAASAGNPRFSPLMHQHAVAILQDRVDYPTLVQLTNMPASLQQTLQQFAATVGPQYAQAALLQITQSLKVDAALACPRDVLIQLMRDASPAVAPTTSAPSESSATPRAFPRPPGADAGPQELVDSISKLLTQFGASGTLANAVASEVLAGIPVPNSPPPAATMPRTPTPAPIDPQAAVVRLRAALPDLEAQKLTPRELATRVFGVTSSDAEWAKALDGDAVLEARLGWDFDHMMPVANAAYEWFEVGKTIPAVITFEALAALMPGYEYYQFMRGVTLQKAERPNDAIAAYGRAIAISPQPHSLTNRGELYFGAKRMKEAAEDLTRAIALDPEERNSFANRARMLMVFIPRQA